jgi:hypothetical protein
METYEIKGFYCKHGGPGVSPIPTTYRLEKQGDELTFTIGAVLVTEPFPQTAWDITFQKALIVYIGPPIKGLVDSLTRDFIEVYNIIPFSNALTYLLEKVNYL